MGTKRREEWRKIMSQVVKSTWFLLKDLCSSPMCMPLEDNLMVLLF